MVQFGFYTWTAVSLLMLLSIFRYDGNPKKAISRYLLICFCWLTYIVTIYRLGIFNDFGLPPRMLLFVIIPAIIGSLFITGTKSFQTILQNTPLHLPVFLQSFRIVIELLIYGSFLQGIFPKRATFEGINYDILVGISALIVGMLIQRKLLSLKWLLAWNIISLIILSITIYSFISTFYFTDYLSKDGSKGFIQFPYLLLPSVLLPVAIFLHILSIKQVLLRQATIVPTLTTA
ncbi:MAG: hypothetical protein ABIN67_09935 [Ferruginibacter sp.]